LFSENSRTNAEGFSKLIEVEFQQMNLASSISSKIAFRYISQSLAQLFVGNIATQHFNLREQMKAEIASHERKMLRASHGQNNRIIDDNNQLVVYDIQILGFMPVCMLAFLWFDDYRKTITGCPCTTWHGAGRAGKALSRSDWNHPKDGVLRWRSWRAHVNTLSSTEGIGKGWSRIPERRTTGCPVETHFREVETRRVAPKSHVSGVQWEHREQDGASIGGPVSVIDQGATIPLRFGWQRGR
jgi:hypothetical protein